MTSIIINILITLVGLTVVLVAVFSIFPNIEKLLEEKLKGSLSRGGKDHGPLAQIFHRYNQKDSKAWTEWVLTQEPAVQSEALDKLVAHIDQGPASWGAITPEAITALSRFENEDHFSILKSVLNAARKMWKKYMVSASCYEAALAGCITINEKTALGIFENELEKAHESEGSEEQVISILSCFKSFSEEVDLKDLFVQIFTDSNLSLKARTTAINTSEEINEDKANEIYAEALKKIFEANAVLNPEDQKIIETLLNFVTREITEESFELLLKAIVNPRTCYTALKVIDLILKSSHDKFSEEQIYKLTHTAQDEQGVVTNTMAGIHNLNPEERTLCRYLDLTQQFPFKKAPVNNEHPNKPMPIPEGAEEIYNNLKDLLRERANGKQQGISGGIVITGYSDEEKLYLCRTLASEKKFHFLYASFEDVIGSSTTAKSLLDLITSHKPCLVYLDDIDGIFKNLDPGFLKSFKHCFTDPLINVIGTLKEEAQIDDQKQCVLFSRDDLKDLFPVAIEVTQLTEAYKNRFLTNKLGVLDSSRGQQAYESLDILSPTNEMTLFEFRKYLSKYFKASLVVNGKLIAAKDFERLDSIDFEGKAEI